jgi:NADPH2:quinone reductase
MKCAVITEPGRAPDCLIFQERNNLTPVGEEIRVRVTATALNRADILQMRGLYPPPPGVPEDIPGLEFVGVIDACGDDVTAVEPGTRVFGLVGGGAFAEQVITNQQCVCPVPPELNDSDAAAVPEAFITAYDALVTQGGMRKDELVLIHAVASGVGSAAVQLVNLWGARAIGTAGGPRKLEAVGKFAPFMPINYIQENFRDAIEREYGKQPVDLILDLLGGSYWKPNLQLLRLKGRLMLVGLLAGSTEETPLALVLRKRLQIRGTVLRSRSLEEKIAVTRAFAEEVVPHFSTGSLRPVVDSVYRFSDLHEGIARMESRKNIGKIVFTL